MTYLDIPIGLSVRPDPENMGIVVGICLLSCMRDEIYVLLPVIAAIFDFRHTYTSDSIPTSLYVLLDPGNMDIDVSACDSSLQSD